MISVDAAQSPQNAAKHNICQSNNKSLGFVLALDAVAQGQKDIVCIVSPVCRSRGCVAAAEKSESKIWKLSKRQKEKHPRRGACGHCSCSYCLTSL